jgi:predicted dehydrogenase
VAKQRFAIVGCGSIESRHEEAFLRLGARAEVVATVDVNLDRARQSRDALGARKAVADYHDVLDDVDAALIALPHHLHHQVGMDFLRAGKHVLMEKPLAISEAQCLDLIHASADNDSVLLIGYVMRYNPLVMKLKDMIDNQELGDVFQVSIWTEQLTHRPDGDWINSAATLGGGQLFSHGCHYVDMLLWFLGAPVNGTHVSTNLGTEWMEREGTSNVSIEFANGALGYHFGTWGARGTTHRYAVHVHGTKGMAELDIHGGKLRLHDDDTIRTVMSSDRVTKKTGDQLIHFLDCIEQGIQPVNGGPASLQGLRVIWRLYEAEERGVVADLTGLGLDEPWDKPGLDRLP